jgi:large repetitive protein
MTSHRWRVAAVLAPVAIATAALATPAVAAPAPTSAPATLTQQCSPDINGTLVNGVCVLGTATVGQQYETFLALNNFATSSYSVVSGSLPPGLKIPTFFIATGSFIGGTPTTPGTYTFTIHAVASGAVVPNLTYRITVVQ